jgi:hypothetical protein
MFTLTDDIIDWLIQNALRVNKARKGALTITFQDGRLMCVVFAPEERVGYELKRLIREDSTPA